MRLILFVFLWCLPGLASAQTAPNADVAQVPVIFTGGHDTDPRDRGRPVILVASALKVPPDVFREAFTHVHPAPMGQGGPTPDEARKNKEALMAALGPYGVTNDRLDQVSNHYRYRRSMGEMWPTTDATAVALVSNGAITGFKITNPGSGYSSPPTISIKDMPDVHPIAALSFGTDFDKNGAVSALNLVAVPK
jgi:hypothetical protein